MTIRRLQGGSDASTKPQLRGACSGRGAHAHDAGCASRIGLAVAAALATCAVAPRAHADDAAAAADVASGGLQEVVVTARKREENLQDVPLSIDVFTKKDMQNLGISGFEDYAQKVPSISFISVGPGTQIFFMRGVSDGSNPNYSNTSATGFFIDDMSLSWWRRAAGPAPLRHRAHRGAERPAGHDLRRRLHGRRNPLHHQQAGRQRIQRRRRLRRRPDPGRAAELDLRGIRQSPAHRRHARLARFRLQRLARRLHRQRSSRPAPGSTAPSPTTPSGRATTTTASTSEGGRAALKWRAQRTSGARSSPTTFSAMSRSAPGTRTRTLARGHGRALRSGGASASRPRSAQFHIDGDVGIGDLVFASTYWSLPTRQLERVLAVHAELHIGGRARRASPA